MVMAGALNMTPLDFASKQAESGSYPDTTWAVQVGGKDYYYVKFDETAIFSLNM